MFSLAVILNMFWRGVSIVGPLIKSAGEVSVALIAAVPSLVLAIGSFLKAVGESPVLSLLFGAATCGTIAFFYGLSFDADIRERHKREAIRTANSRADVAIGKVRKEYEARIEAICRQTKCPRNR